MARYQLLVLPGLCLQWGLWLGLELPVILPFMLFHFCEPFGLPRCPFSPSLGDQGLQSGLCPPILMRDLSGLSLSVQVHAAMRDLHDLLVSVPSHATLMTLLSLLVPPHPGLSLFMSILMFLLWFPKIFDRDLQ